MQATTLCNYKEIYL